MLPAVGCDLPAHPAAPAASATAIITTSNANKIDFRLNILALSFLSLVVFEKIWLVTIFLPHRISISPPGIHIPHGLTLVITSQVGVDSIQDSIKKSIPSATARNHLLKLE
jgi:hypothetical protein